MAKYAKWIGGGLGWAVGGPIGAMAGFALGALFDNASDIDERRLSGNQTSGRTNTDAGDFGMSMVILSAAVMRADGKVMRSELDYVKNFFLQQFGEARAKELVSALKEVLEHDVSTRQVCMQIRVNMDHSSRLQLLHYLFGIGYADGKITPQDLHVLNTMARYLGISQKDFYSINAMFGGAGYQYSTYQRRKPDLSAAYQILEVEQKASDEEVKKAYRRLVNKHHPDRVSHLGPDFTKAAKEKFQKIQEAYDQVKTSRGMR